MKRYIYHIEYTDYYSVPWLPRVLAEKTAKALRKAQQKEYPRRQCYKFATRKASYRTIKDGTPHGYESYQDRIQKKEV